MLGLMPFLAPVYAIIIAVVAYFGIRVFVKKRKQQIQNAMGEGICAVCGAKISHGKCPNCDNTYDGSKI
ncbi:MAG: hypothetical protein KGI11_00845 [Thaumarchaeota archaeon]|nr:hypothetical protein [Nitrososphaerota archaeon]